MNIEQIRIAKVGTTIWDKGDRNSVAGLHVRVRSESKRIFYAYYRSRSGKQRRPKIGEFGIITLADARRRTKIIMDRVAVGEDPQGDWNNAKKEMTGQELFDLVLAKHWDQERFIKSRHKYMVEMNWRLHLKPTFGNLRLSDITGPKVEDWHSNYRASVYAGNRSLEVLSKMFRFAERKELVPPGVNPCRGQETHTETKRTRFASSDEIRTLTRILDREASDHPRPVAFLYLLLLTGSRPSLIERAQWHQLQTFELDGMRYGKLTLKGKSSSDTGVDDSVIVPPQGMKVIDELPRVVGATITGIKHPKKFWSRVRKEAGIPDIWARDLRRTFATIGLSNGVGLDEIGELLNHSSTQTTKLYGKLMDGAKLAAATKIATRIDEIKASDPTVISIDARIRNSRSKSL
jgi:integrase